MRKTAFFLVSFLLLFGLVACQSPAGGGGALSPGTAGGNPTATGAFGAQTVGGDQGAGQTPQTGTTGTATQNWYFASQGDSSVQLKLLETLSAMGAKPEEIVAAMSALNGAPENVTITTGDQSIQSGSGEQTGSTAGTGSLTGAGRTVNVPENR